MARTPLTARSVIASTLLGVHPPRLATRHLVRCGALFDIPDGTVRVAISRMVAAGELEPDGDGYRLAGDLLGRQSRQDSSRRADRISWEGSWELAVVSGGSRSANERAALREAMRRLKLTELREGTWLRPANLAADRAPGDRAVVAGQCRWFRAVPEGDPAELAAGLWDLGGWEHEARSLLIEMRSLERGLDARATEALAPAFETSAAVLRHLLADPLLPDELLPSGWLGEELRATYDRFDALFVERWASWLRSQP